MPSIDLRALCGGVASELTAADEEAIDADAPVGVRPGVVGSWRGDDDDDDEGTDGGGSIDARCC